MVMSVINGNSIFPKSHVVFKSDGQNVIASWGAGNSHPTEAISVWLDVRVQTAPFNNQIQASGQMVSVPPGTEAGDTGQILVLTWPITTSIYPPGAVLVCDLVMRDEFDQAIFFPASRIHTFTLNIQDEADPPGTADIFSIGSPNIS